MRSVPILARALAPFALGLALAAAAPCMASSPAGWSGNFGLPSFDGRTDACAIYDGRYVVAGDFQWAGATHAANIAVWNGTGWDELGGGIGAKVTRLAVWSDKLIAGTSSYPSGSPVMQFNGLAWTPLGAEMYGQTDALLVADNTLYAAGMFYIVGSTNGLRVVKWNGLAWEPVGGEFDNHVNALALWHGDLYAGGAFLNSDAGYVGGLARWDGAHWVAAGPVLPSAASCCGEVRALAVWQDRLVAGGYFASVGGVAANGIAAWDGAAWSALPGTPADDFVSDLEPEGSVLHVAGVLQQPSLWAAGLVTFDGQGWQPPSTYPSWGVADIATSGGSLLAVGTQADLVQGTPPTNSEGTRNVLVRDATWHALEAWQPSMRGLRGPSWTEVDALHVHDGSLFAGGYFEQAAHPPGWTNTEGIARWDGDGWVALEGGLRGWVQVMESWNGLLVAGGNNLYASGHYSAVLGWDGAGWQPVGQRLDGAPRAFTVWDGALVAAGRMSDPAAGGGDHAVMINRGSGWSPLGGPLLVDGSVVRDAAVFAGELYVAGSRLNLPGVGWRSLVRWNGAEWTEVPGAPSFDITCLRLRPDGLWMGQGVAYYPVVGGGGVVRWNGETWTDMGLRTFTVFRLAELDGDVYACGSGYMDSGPTTLARWNGGSWASVPNAPEEPVLAAEALGHDLFVGGQFRRAGGRPAEALARWSARPAGGTPATIALSAGPNPMADHVMFRFALAQPGHVRLSVYDLGGALVARPIDEDMAAGTSERAWQLPIGSALRAGVYFAQLTTPEGEAKTRLVVVK